MKFRAVIVAGGLLSIAVACGTSPATTPTCVPGQSIVCVGPGACAGGQVCNSEGTAYSACDCGSPRVDGGPVDSSSDVASVTDASGDVGIDSPSATDSGTTDGGPWTPKALAGLSLWLDDTVGVVMDPQKTGYVKRWLDQSGNGNDAEAMNFSGTGIALDPSAIKGHDAYNCGFQSFFQIPDSTSLHFGTGDFLVAMVMKLGSNNSTIDPSKMFWKGASVSLQIQPSSTTLHWLVGVQSIASTCPSGAFSAVIGRATALALEVGANTATGGTSTTDVTNGTVLQLCEPSSANTSPNSEIAEVIVVKGTVGSSDLANLRSYFKAKFGL